MGGCSRFDAKVVPIAVETDRKCGLNTPRAIVCDGRRGTHAPSDFEKVEDIACWAHIDVADLLIESGDRTMDEKLTENQLDVLCVLWNQAYDFLDLCEETDHFVWPTTDLRCVPDSILHDIKVNPEDVDTPHS